MVGIRLLCEILPVQSQIKVKKQIKSQVTESLYKTKATLMPTTP